MAEPVSRTLVLGRNSRVNCTSEDFARLMEAVLAPVARVRRDGSMVLILDEVEVRFAASRKTLAARHRA